MKFWELLIIGFLGLALCFGIGAICWPYSIEHVAAWCGRPDVDITWWKGGLLGMIPAFGQFGVVAAAVVWILVSVGI